MGTPTNQKGEELFVLYLNLRNNKISALNINALQASVDILAEEIYKGVWKAFDGI